MEQCPPSQGVNANDFLFRISTDARPFFSNLSPKQKKDIQDAASLIRCGLEEIKCLSVEEIKELRNALKMIGHYGLPSQDMTIEVLTNQISESRISCLTCLRTPNVCPFRDPKLPENIMG